MIELAREQVDSHFDPRVVEAGVSLWGTTAEYLTLVDRYGSPAFPLPQLERQREDVRQGADQVLAAALRLSLEPAPPVDPGAACRIARPAAPGGELAFELPPGGDPARPGSRNGVAHPRPLRRRALGRAGRGRPRRAGGASHPARSTAASVAGCGFPGDRRRPVSQPVARRLSLRPVAVTEPTDGRATSGGMARSAPELSIVVPVFNEREGLGVLLEEIERACRSMGAEWEAIFVDDGSTDGSRALLEELAAERERVLAVRLRRNFGKSAALMAGFEHSSGEIVVTLDGDGQDDPSEIPALVGKLDDGYQLVSGWKRERRDPAVRRWASRFFNWVTGRLSGVRLHDLNCGLKAYRGDLARELRIYGELHRYIPVLAAQRGWRVTEVPVHHRPRMHGSSKFGFARYTRGPFDLLTVLFIGRYQHRPLHLFGGLGVALMLAGVAISAYLAVLWIGGEAIGDRPLLLLGVVLIVVGIQLLTFGLLGQMLAAMHQERAASRSSDPNVERVVGGRPSD